MTHSRALAVLQAEQNRITWKRDQMLKAVRDLTGAERDRAQNHADEFAREHAALQHSIDVLERRGVPR